MPVGMATTLARSAPCLRCDTLPSRNGELAVPDLKEKLEELWKSPHSQGRDGIHISAQLRIDAMQLDGHRIDELENQLLTLKEDQ